MVRSLQPLIKGYDAEIIVVDNASPNRSGEVLKAHAKDGYHFIGAPENRGYAAGNNIGLRYAKERGATYAWVLNNDVTFPDRNLLPALLEVLQKQTDVAAVSPDVYSGEGYLYNRELVRPTWMDLTFGLLQYRKKGRNAGKKDWCYAYRVQGCCFLADIEKLEQCGYLDENTFLYYEEAILAERLRRKKYRCACVTKTKVIHRHSTTVLQNIGKSGYRRAYKKSYAYYLKEYRRFPLWQQVLCKAFFAVKVYFI